MSTHPSFLELDRLAAQGADALQHPHVAGCGSCQQHLARLAQPVGVPAWALELGRPRRRRLWDGWGLRSLVAVGAMAALAVVVLPRVMEMEPVRPAFQTKGGPSVTVHLKRGEQVSRWRQGEPLRAGDVVRLELAAEGFGQYAVLAKDGAQWVLLSQGTLSSGPLLLPEAWRVDGVDPEELRVVFTQEPVEASTLKLAAESRPQGPLLHTVSVTLEKEAQP